MPDLTSRLAVSLLLLLVGCGAPVATAVADDAALDDAAVASEVASDGESPSPDAPDSASIGTDSAVPETSPDGGALPVRRLPCVSTAQLASDLPKNVYGAVEAELVAITPPGTKTSCPTDTGHVHLQLDITGKRYDVAVNVESTTGAEMAIFTKDLPPTLQSFGYHPAKFDFPTDLGAHSTDFVPTAKAALITRIESELASASRVSIHGLTYTDGTGIHDIHRYGSDRDGVMIVRGGGAAGMDHAVALRFSTDVF
jgi:hypothetical protein